MSRYSKLLMGVLVALFVVVGVMKAAVVYTDYLWFQEMGQASVFRTMWFTRVLVGALVGVIFFAWLYVNIRVARKLLPKDTVIGQRLLPDAERASIEQHIDKVLLLFALIGSIITAITAGSQWVQWLRYFNSVPFSKVDPLLGMDISFYIFKLPLIQYAWKTAFYSSVIVFVVSTLIHLYNESIRIHGRNIQATIQAQWHCLGLLAWCFLLKGVGYYLARFALMYEPTKAVPGGPGYAAAEYRLPVFSFQIGAVVLAAAICIACIKLKNLRLPAFALAGVIIFSILFGVSFPAVMEHLYVRPNEIGRASCRERV